MDYGDNMKKIAAINDLSGFGKCSLGVAIPIISSMGIQCCPLTTGVFSNQTGYDSYKSVDFSDYMQGFIDEWKKLDAQFDGILTGFIPNSKQGKIIAQFIDEFKNDNTIVVVDPVMGDNGELYPCYDNESISAIKLLVSKADIITPNLTELCCITNENYTSIASLSPEQMINKITAMCKQTGKRVVATGICYEDKIITAVYDNGSLDIIEAKKLGESFSGTGDILASIITAGTVMGKSLIDSARLASEFIAKSIEQTIIESGDKYNSADGIYFEKYLQTLGGDRNAK